MTSEEANSPTWLMYERCVALFVLDKYGSLDTTVQANVKLPGTLSRTKRQIDVLVSSRWSDTTESRLIVDAKMRTRAVNVNDVEAFEGLMKDCNVQRGLIVCTAGYTKSAKQRAEDAINIEVVSLDDALSRDWTWEECLGKCAQRRAAGRGMVLYSEETVLNYASMWWILQSGKCDRCHSFHVWCWSCGEKFIVLDEHMYQCYCGIYWASVPESEESGHVGKPQNTWLMMRTNLTNPDESPTAIDRKPVG